MHHHDVMKIALQHGIHAYADDMQTYASCQAADQQSAINQLLQCVDDIDVIKPAETELG